MCTNPLTGVVPNIEKSICFVVNNGKFLLINKNLSDGINNWRIPGGIVQKNEDYLEAIFRIVHQQTNIDLRKVNFTYCCKIESTDQTDPILHVFHSVLKKDNSLESFSKKKDQLKWFDQSQVEYMNLQRNYKEAFQFICIPHFYQEVNQQEMMKQPLLDEKSLCSRTIINLIGTVGAGKGTQGKQLSEKYKLSTLSLGDIYRNECRSQTPIGNLILLHHRTNGQMAFAPNEIAYGLLLKQIANPIYERGFILDGFPRTAEQGKVYNDSFLRPNDIHIPIYLALNESDIYRRLEHRYICSQCEKQVREEDKLVKEGCCPACDGTLIKRKEDISREKIDQRLQFFKKHIPEVISSVVLRDPISIIYAEHFSAPQDIFKRIKEVIEQRTLLQSHQNRKKSDLKSKHIAFGMIFCLSVMAIGSKMWGRVR
ncbi:nucleoside monophosphate kinase [Candidatus Rhabdochlamydia sp. T3358]|uniref:nucleoside monophosphate kinase n=1 Tax=Candidatus Rhabdochlamydia sp. T3358 TaxID=2099795 RepID=UPI0010B5DE0A|nr:nucleoside monophosphate kinase [Candidatus Rhabdochlamydia sp. T3358]VHO04724.1 Adenylate kinase [Candidatus Rhabdochlamydia sp. T3358]